jgi:hypothetical protein
VCELRAVDAEALLFILCSFVFMSFVCVSMTAWHADQLQWYEAPLLLFYYQLYSATHLLSYSIHQQIALPGQRFVLTPDYGFVGV